MDDFDLGHVRYENSYSMTIYFTYTLVGQGGRFSNDNEHSDYYQITIGDSDADLFVSNEEGKSSYLIWVDEDLGVAYKLSSEVDQEELIAMAESVKKIN